MENENKKELDIFAFGDAMVRTFGTPEEPWFLAKDVCAALGLNNVSMAVNGNESTGNIGLDDDEKGIMIVDTLGGPQQVICVNESGLYSLIFRSRKSEARAFKRWVTKEVIPAIRRQGFYVNPSAQVSNWSTQPLPVAHVQPHQQAQSFVDAITRMLAPGARLKVHPQQLYLLVKRYVPAEEQYLWPYEPRGGACRVGMLVGEAREQLTAAGITVRRTNKARTGIRPLLFERPILALALE